MKVKVMRKGLPLESLERAYNPPPQVTLACGHTVFADEVEGESGCPFCRANAYVRAERLARIRAGGQEAGPKEIDMTQVIVTQTEAEAALTQADSVVEETKAANEKAHNTYREACKSVERIKANLEQAEYAVHKALETCDVKQNAYNQARANRRQAEEMTNAKPA